MQGVALHDASGPNYKQLAGRKALWMIASQGDILNGIPKVSFKAVRIHGFRGQRSIQSWHSSVLGNAVERGGGRIRGK